MDLLAAGTPPAADPDDSDEMRALLSDVEASGTERTMKWLSQRTRQWSVRCAPKAPKGRRAPTRGRSPLPHAKRGELWQLLVRGPRAGGVAYSPPHGDGAETSFCSVYRPTAIPLTPEGRAAYRRVLAALEDELTASATPPPAYRPWIPAIAAMALAWMSEAEAFAVCQVRRRRRRQRSSGDGAADAPQTLLCASGPCEGGAGGASSPRGVLLSPTRMHSWLRAFKPTLPAHQTPAHRPAMAPQNSIASRGWRGAACPLR